ncbi:histidine phosphatase family protein [Pseudidiomarina sp. CB1]|uniref:SixA phosphatase family protein n=1 Tax=Pseudidiomarina sp. CB1 TaxID=2972484 RepID=UPI0021614209|nr:phosphoglycerate mutase family protein [Pseudidiomarina sp. CB1]
MKQYVIGILLSVCAVLGGSSTMANEFTVYVVRHAEKAQAESDPPLSEQGVQRAQTLAGMLQKAQIKAIYSTPYQRTQQTAQPLAKLLGITVQTYHPATARELVEQLKQAGENALVVGHSNTVPALVRSLGGHSEDLTERDYGDLFQLTLRDCGCEQSECDVHQTHLFVPVIAADHNH